MIASAAPSPISLLRSSPPQFDLRRTPAAAPPPRQRRSSVCAPISAASSCASGAAEREYTYTSARIGASPFAAPSSPPSLYDLLGVTAGATCAEIKLAYRRLARECHPDVVEVDRRETSANRFMRVHAAYATLSDPQTRADYDRELLLLLQSRRPVYTSSQVTASTLSGGFRRRTWETDQCW